MRERSHFEMFVFLEVYYDIKLFSTNIQLGFNAPLFKLCFCIMLYFFCRSYTNVSSVKRPKNEEIVESMACTQPVTAPGNTSQISNAKDELI